MTFIYDQIPKEEMYLYQSVWYLNNKGEPLFLPMRAIDFERNIFLVHPDGSDGGAEPSRSKYVLKMEGFYWGFQGFLDPYKSNPHFEVSQLFIPMNWAPHTMKIVNTIEEALRVYLDDPQYDKPIIFDPPDYVGGMWRLDDVKDVFLIGMGQNDNYRNYEERNYAKYYFCLGERNDNTLYNFRDRKSVV